MSPAVGKEKVYSAAGKEEYIRDNFTTSFDACRMVTKFKPRNKIHMLKWGHLEQYSEKTEGKGWQMIG